MDKYNLPGAFTHEGIVFCDGFRVQSMEKIRDMTFVKGDILIASYPKTGTTWMEEITWTVNKDADLTEALAQPLHSRMLFLEADDPVTKKSGIEDLENRERPAIMKTHLPANFFDKAIKQGDVKVIITMRNPKDTLVSFYHFHRGLGDFTGNYAGTFDDFFEVYKNKRLMYGDFFDWYTSWLPYLDLPNVQIFTYEDMKADVTSIIHRLSAFLGKVLSDDQVKTIVNHTTFKSMKSNKMTNYEDEVSSDISPFMRKGEVGDWKNYFSEEQSRFVDEEYKSKFEKRGLFLKFETEQ